MKIVGSRINGFLNKPDPACPVVLVYGPDAGLVRERVKHLTKTIVENISDPFRVTEFNGSALKSDPALLRDESQAMAFGGGRRVIIVRDASDTVADVISDFLDHPAGDALILIEAGDLGPRTKLRKTFEAAKNGAALPCYSDDARSLGAVIDETLRGYGLSVSPDARAFLAGVLGSDRMVTRGELEKLALYKGDEGSEITLDDAIACSGDTAAVSLDAVIYSAANGNQKSLDAALDKAYSEGVQPIIILRMLARHLQRLHIAMGAMAKGQNADQAVKGLRPPLIFTQTDSFLTQLRQWATPSLVQAMDIITEAELDCKTTGMPAEAICGRALMRVAQAATRGRRR